MIDIAHSSELEDFGQVSFEAVPFSSMPLAKLNELNTN